MFCIFVSVTTYNNLPGAPPDCGRIGASYSTPVFLPPPILLFGGAIDAAAACFTSRRCRCRSCARFARK